MGLFGNKKMQQELEQLRARNAYLEANLTPNMQETDQVAARLEHMKQEVAEFEQNASQWDEYIGKLEAKSKALETEIATRKNEVVDLDSILSAQDYGLYKPRFAFANSTQYRDALKEVRDEQNSHQTYQRTSKKDHLVRQWKQDRGQEDGRRYNEAADTRIQFRMRRPCRKGENLEHRPEHRTHTQISRKHL